MSTSLVYKRSGLFIALQADLLVLHLIMHQQSYALSLPPQGRFRVQVWFVSVQNNLIQRNKNCYQISGYLCNKVTESKPLTSCSTYVLYLLHKFSKT